MVANLRDDPAAQAVPRVSGLTAWARAQTQACRAERRDARENRDRILMTARVLFGARGVDAVSMVEVARAAGVGQGTLYRRFPHKGALCQALLDDSISAFHDEVMARLAECADAEPALDQLVWMLTRMLEYIETNAALLSQAGLGERRHDRYHDPWYAWLHETVVAILTQAVASGEAAPLDAACVADALLAACDPDLYHFRRCEQGFARERIAASLRHIVMALHSGPQLPAVVGGGAAGVTS